MSTPMQHHVGDNLTVPRRFSSAFIVTASEESTDGHRCDPSARWVGRSRSHTSPRAAFATGRIGDDGRRWWLTTVPSGTASSWRTMPLPVRPPEA